MWSRQMLEDPLLILQGITREQAESDQRGGWSREDWRRLCDLHQPLPSHDK